MRTLLANSLSALLHVVALGGLAIWTVDANWLQYQVAAGQPILVQMSLASPQTEAVSETQPVALEITPPTPVETPLETQPPEPSTMAVDRQKPLVEIAEEVASAEAPPADTPPNSTASPSRADPPKEPAQTTAQALPQRQPTRDLPDFQTAALPAQTAVEAGANVPDTLPRKLPLNPAPPYPEDAWRARIQGRVVLKVLVEGSGLVGAVAVHASSGSTSLDESALTTVRKWRFEPARRRGAVVAHEVLVPVRFTILTY
jgi:protein TonB